MAAPDAPRGRAVAVVRGLPLVRGVCGRLAGAWALGGGVQDVLAPLGVDARVEPVALVVLVEGDLAQRPRCRLRIVAVDP